MTSQAILQRQRAETLSSVLYPGKDPNTYHIQASTSPIHKTLLGRSRDQEGTKDNEKISGYVWHRS